MCWDKLSLGALGLKLQKMQPALIGQLNLEAAVLDKLHLKDMENRHVLSS